MSIFDLEPVYLENLTQDNAVDTFRKLLWAEGSRIGIGKNLITVPHCINVGDGGIDAVIEDANPTNDEVIPQGFTGFQIKSSDLPPSRCMKELHINEDLGSSLKPEIQKLIDREGTYVLVLFKQLTHRKIEERKQAIINELGSQKVRIYALDKIIGFIERFPALVADLKTYLQYCIPFEKWKPEIEKPKTFITDGLREDIIAGIRNKLREPTEYPRFIRIIGQAGIGKTRLIFESLSPDDLKNRVVYIRSGRLLIETPFFNTLLLDDGTLEGIILVDECSIEDHETILRSFSDRHCGLDFITLSNDITTARYPTLQYTLEPLNQQSIEDLIKKEYKLPGELVHRVAIFAGGYPLIAVILSQTYLNEQLKDVNETLLLNDDNLINRLISSTPLVNSDNFRTTKKALMGVAVFQSLGYRREAESEAKAIATYMGINWLEFRSIIAEQKRRGIVRGEYFIFVTPFALSVRLMKEWWELCVQNSNDLLNEFFSCFPERFKLDMQKRFISNMSYMSSSDIGRTIIKELLSKDGVFSDAAILKKNDFYGRFFLKIAEADPEEALHFLKRTIGKWEKEQLVSFTVGRRYVVWALERIIVWQDLFLDGARLLLRLAETENESYGNNATGIFCSLFTAAPAPVAPTEASPDERFPVLLDAIQSGSIETKKIGLKGFRNALETYNIIRFASSESQGVRTVRLWRPKEYSEIFSYLKKVWIYLADHALDFEDEIKDEAIAVLLESARGITQLNKELAKMVADTFMKLALHQDTNKDKLLEVIIQIIHYDGNSVNRNVLKEFKLLRDDLTGTSYSDRIKRYIGADFLEDFISKKNKYDTKKVEKEIELLARESLEQTELLENEYEWILTEKAKRGYLFGYKLGKIDKEISLLSKIISRQREIEKKGSLFFMGGYLKALFEDNPLIWDQMMDSFMQDPFYSGLIPELTLRSGMTDKSARGILKLVKEEKVSVSELGNFVVGGTIKKISEPFFLEWIVILLADPTHMGIIIALDLFTVYYVYEETDKRIPKELALKILLHRVFWDNPKKVQRQQLSDFHWQELASRTYGQYPEIAPDLTGKIIESFGDNNSIMSSVYKSYVLKFLLEVLKDEPSMVWGLIKKYIGPPIDSRSYNLREWLRGGMLDDNEQGALELIPLEEIWKWIDEDLKKRAWYLAYFVPPTLFRSEERNCLAREVLVRYGDRQDVVSNFTANYSSGFSRGLYSNHLRNKKDRLLEFREYETNQNVIKWIDDYLLGLDRQIIREEMNEEREGYRR